MSKIEIFSLVLCTKWDKTLNQDLRVKKNYLYTGFLYSSHFYNVIIPRVLSYLNQAPM